MIIYSVITFQLERKPKKLQNMMSRLLCKRLLLACCVCGKITVWLCNSTVAETICSRCDPAAAGWVFKHVLEKVDPQNPEKEKKN